MAVSIAGSEFDDEGDFAETHEINVTPFIDVMLVLLIIFMVAAPLATVDLPIDLPTSSAMPQKKPDKPTYVSIKPDLTIAIGETPVKRVDLIAALDTSGHQPRRRGTSHLPARRPRRRLWRADGRDGTAADRRLSASSSWWLEEKPAGWRQHRTSPEDRTTTFDRRLRTKAVAPAVDHGGGGRAGPASGRSGTRDRPPERAADGVELGAQGIEIGLVFGSDKTEITDLPPGPDSNESAASPQLVEQKAVVKETDLPKDKPIESETPDRIVTNNELKKPKEDDPKIEAVQTTASQASVAQEATAKQNLDQEGTGIKEQGLAKDREKERAEYAAIISAMIERNKARHIPRAARRNPRPSR